jgi:DNA ligase-1
MFKPLLASPAEDYVFPLYVSVKIDGIRCCIQPSAGAVSRQIKPIPNNHIRTILNANEALKYCDGELLTFTNGKMDNFNQVQSKVMSVEGTPDFAYYIFDHFQFPDKPYTERRLYMPNGHGHVKVVSQFIIYNQAELDIYEEMAVTDGWEGLIARSIHGPYKYGRSTAKEGTLLKVVRKHRAEGIVTATYERLHNANEATINALGYTERTSHKDNKVGRDDLGGLSLLWDGICNGVAYQGITEPIHFDCGTGYDDSMRSRLWGMREDLIGKIVTFEFRGIGTNKRPRFPVFIGFREDI